jgi:hypothetical protein
MKFSFFVDKDSLEKDLRFVDEKRLNVKEMRKTFDYDREIEEDKMKIAEIFAQIGYFKYERVFSIKDLEDVLKESEVNEVEIPKIIERVLSYGKVGRPIKED